MFEAAHHHIMHHGVQDLMFHFGTFWIPWIINSIILYKKYNKFWLFKSLPISFICSFLSIFIAIYWFSDNSNGKPDRPISDMPKKILD